MVSFFTILPEKCVLDQKVQKALINPRLSVLVFTRRNGISLSFLSFWVKKCEKVVILRYFTDYSCFIVRGRHLQDGPKEERVSGVRAAGTVVTGTRDVTTLRVVWSLESMQQIPCYISKRARQGR